MSEPIKARLMQFRPRAGDTWEVKLPGKRKIVKEVGDVQRRSVSIYKDSRWAGYKYIMYVNWYRLPKGRYSGIRVKSLLAHGKRISTRAEREAYFQLLMENARKRRLERQAR